MTSTSSPPPAAVWLPSAFFVMSGLLHTALTLVDTPHRLGWDNASVAVGGGLISLLLAFGLWRRLALCRQVAIVYCLAAVVTYAGALAAALTRQPLLFPPSVVYESSFEIPSCVLLFRHLRSRRAASLFSRPFWS